MDVLMLPSSKPLTIQGGHVLGIKKTPEGMPMTIRGHLKEDSVGEERKQTLP